MATADPVPCKKTNTDAAHAPSAAKGLASLSCIIAEPVSRRYAPVSYAMDSLSSHGWVTLRCRAPAWARLPAGWTRGNGCEGIELASPLWFYSG